MIKFFVRGNDNPSVDNPVASSGNRMISKPTVSPGALAAAIAPIVAQSMDGDLAAPSKDSAAMMPYWEKVQDIIDGEHCIKMCAEKYLPKFPHEAPDDYRFRLSLGEMINIYSDILEGLASKPFDEEVQLVKTEKEKTKIPDQIDEFIEDVDGSRNNLTRFAVDTFYRGINSAIDWIFVDYPIDEREPDAPQLSVAEEKILGIRPLWKHVLALNVLEVRSSVVGGNEKLTYVRILEPGNPMHVRVMQSDGATWATWDLFEQSDKIDPQTNKKAWIRIKSGTFSINEIPMVPFITGRREGTSWVFRPPMKDAADAQIQLYRKQTGLNYATVMAGHPMLAGNGVRSPVDAAGKPLPIPIGPGRALIAPPNQDGSHGTWAMLNADSAVLTFLQGEVDKTIERLREIGRQPLTAQSGNLTVITTAVAASKARSAVAAWAFALKDALENAMTLTCKWFGIDKDTYDPEIEVHTDFDQFINEASKSADLTTIQAARDAGDISQETYLYELKRRRILSADFNFDEELNRLLTENPSGDELSALPTPKPGVIVPPVPKPLKPKVPPNVTP